METGEVAKAAEPENPETIEAPVGEERSIPEPEVKIDDAEAEEPPESESELEAELAVEAQAEAEVRSAETDMNNTPVDEEPDTSELDLEPDADDVSSNEEAAIPESEVESESPPAEAIPQEIVAAARAVMGICSESRPDGNVFMLEASSSEWMTLTDDELSYEPERELLDDCSGYVHVGRVDDLVPR